MEIAKQTIEKWGLCPEHTKITVGVSGGADSIALLHLLWKLSPDWDWDLQVVHVHHGLRGAEADRDQKFVEDMCGAWNIPCYVFAFDVEQEAKLRGIGTEEAGRQLRYESFQSLAGDGVIAVAHNQNDQSETVLMRLARGASTKGLSGMRPKRGNVVRPLLYCSRAEIEAYCKEENLDFCTDHTNGENMYTRNRIRNEILPLLEEIYPKATRHMAKSCEQLAEENQFLQTMAEEKLMDSMVSKGDLEIILQREKLAKESPVLVRRMALVVLGELGQRKDVSAVHLDGILDLLHQETGKSLDLPGGICVSTSYDTLMFAKKNECLAIGFSYKLPENGRIFVSECHFDVETTIFLKKPQENHGDIYTKIFDYDTINNTLFCRSRQAGDRLRFSYGTKKLKDFFIDTKTAKTKRETMPLIAFDKEVIWLVGEFALEAYLPSEDTKRFLQIRIGRK